MNEDDLIETFVRGSGAGGQKINKTASKVLLIHGPTQIRVECQDTRSLQQNRKIARKRLKLKLDEYWNGSQSKNQKKISIKVSKKQKQKTRNKARLRKKKESEDDSDETGSIE
jgi:protein subunit release factor B